ncbi:MAG: ABC transporter permease [Bacilli bacterium]|nr:ABC transporter permease [Bacilli bacterium]
MKTTNDIKFAFLKSIRDKTKFFYVLLISLCCFISLIIIGFYFNITEFIDESIEKNPAFNTILVTLNKEEDLSDVDHILDIHKSNNDFYANYTSFKNEKFDGWLLLSHGTPDTVPEVIYGKNIDKNSEDIAICPAKFYPDSGAQHFKINSSDILKNTDTLNSTFTIEYNSYKKNKFDDGIPIKDKTLNKTFKIVGLYDNTKTLNFNNECFVTPSVLKEITDTIDPYLDENSISGTYILIDDTKNLNYVKNELYKKGYTDIEMKKNIDIDIVKSLNQIVVVLLVVVIMGIIVLNALYIKKQILIEKSNIGILKALGYKKNKIKKIYILENMFLSTLAFVIAITVFIFTFLIIKYKFFVSFRYFGINLFLNYKIIFLPFLLTIMLSTLICSIILNKVLKSDIIKLLESEE